MTTTRRKLHHWLSGRVEVREERCFNAARSIRLRRTADRHADPPLRRISALVYQDRPSFACIWIIHLHSLDAWVFVTARSVVIWLATNDFGVGVYPIQMNISQVLTLFQIFTNDDLPQTSFSLLGSWALCNAVSLLTRRNLFNLLKTGSFN